MQGRQEIKVGFQIVHRITGCPWIAGGYAPKNALSFDENILCRVMYATQWTEDLPGMR